MTVYAIFSLACNDCETHYPASPDVLHSDIAIVAAALADGWTRKTGRHRCPDCTVKAEALGSRLPRGICATCNTGHALNAAGNLRQHNKPATPGNRRWTGWCDGSRKAPVAAPVADTSGEGRAS